MALKMDLRQCPWPHIGTIKTRKTPKTRSSLNHPFCQIFKTLFFKIIGCA